MTTFDAIALVLTGVLAVTIGSLGLYVVVERLRAGHWPWLLDLLARRKWK